MPSVLSYLEELHKWKDREPSAIAQTLPDDVLLEIFKYHRLALLTFGPWKWYRLAQVCRRWRFVVFAYPRLLGLRIVPTNKNPIRETPHFWPAALPVVMQYSSLSEEDEDNISDILKNPARICEMDIDITSSLLEKCAPLFEQPFPTLEYLRLKSQGAVPGAGRVLVFPDNFLRSPTPRLRVVRLQDGLAVFPMLPRLISASENLASLQLVNIQAQGIFTAQDLAVALSSATKLESLEINIYSSFFPHPSTQKEHAPRFFLPALLEFQYVGESSFLDAFASRIDAPIIEHIGATFFSDYGGYYTYELCGLFARGEELRSSRRRKIHIQFFEESAAVFKNHFTRFPSSPGSFRVQLVNRGGLLYNYISLMDQICLGFQSQGIMHKVTRVEIKRYYEYSRWQCDLVIARWHTESVAARWLNLLRALSGVQRLQVVGALVSSVVFALAQVSGEETGEIMPELRDLHLLGELGTSAAIEPFIAARKLYGLPVSVHYKGLDWHDDCSDE
ncbi:hypothetical protein V8E53_007516 [Lactarius tabidus]